MKRSILGYCFLGLLWAAAAVPDTYETRRDGLSVAAAYSPDHCDFETTLDSRPFSDLLNLVGPEIVSNPAGWTVEARTGGRPFLCFDQITLNAIPWPFNPAGFSPGTSGIDQSEIDAHFAAGKTVNRLWFIHPASNGYPIVLVMTPDGFFNISGATAPKLQGAATRFGFIGEPFSQLEDYAQHTDNLDIVPVDNDTLRLLFDVHSEAGEGVVEVELRWISGAEEPELEIRSAHLPRFTAQLGFVGVNFMRGPTYSGLLSAYGTPEGGIEAYHDGRSVFLEKPDGSVIRNLLTPPVAPDVVVREDLDTDVAPRTRFIMDQPQNAVSYFSTNPGIAYEERTDLILELSGSSVGPVSVRRAQVAVDLNDVNPEANETINIFYAVAMSPGRTDEFSYLLQVADEDFEERFPATGQGIVYVSDKSWPAGSLFFLPLDETFMPAGPARPLTDGVLENPRRPSASADGRFVIFDASANPLADNNSSTRIHLLDLFRGTVRRITIDPYGSSTDRTPALSRNGRYFTFVSNRSGNFYLKVDDVASGLGSGFGVTLSCGADSDWSHSRNEVATVCGSELRLLDVATMLYYSLAIRSGLREPKFSPDGNRVAYAADTGVYVVNRDGTGDVQLLPDGGHPTWADSSLLIVERTVTAETDLYLVDVTTSVATRLTPEDGFNCSEPEYVFQDLLIFQDGFESSDLSGWTSSPP